jgi:hypothetical protein
MATLTTRRAFEADVMTPVEADADVVAARQAYEEIAARQAALEAEWRGNAVALNPDTSSQDHRTALTLPERLRAEERQRELVPLLRLIPVELGPAAEALAAARRRAYAARYAPARQRVQERLRAFYAALDQLAAGPHRELLREITAMNEMLASPTASGLVAWPVPPPFDPLLLAWPELREGPDGPVAARRRYLEPDGWLP